MNLSHYFTVDPALPHPDNSGDFDVAPLPLIDAVRWAVRVLRDPNAGSFERTRAATELLISFEQLEG